MPLGRARHRFILNPTCTSPTRSRTSTSQGRVRLCRYPDHEERQGLVQAPPYDFEPRHRIYQEPQVAAGQRDSHEALHDMRRPQARQSQRDPQEQQAQQAPDYQRGRRARLAHLAPRAGQEPQCPQCLLGTEQTNARRRRYRHAPQRPCARRGLFRPPRHRLVPGQFKVLDRILPYLKQTFPNVQSSMLQQASASLGMQLHAMSGRLPSRDFNDEW